MSIISLLSNACSPAEQATVLGFGINHYASVGFIIQAQILRMASQRYNTYVLIRDYFFKPRVFTKDV